MHADMRPRMYLFTFNAERWRCAERKLPVHVLGSMLLFRRAQRAIELDMPAREVASICPSPFFLSSFSLSSQFSDQGQVVRPGAPWQCHVASLLDAPYRGERLTLEAFATALSHTHVLGGFVPQGNTHFFQANATREGKRKRKELISPRTTDAPFEIVVSYSPDCEAAARGMRNFMHNINKAAEPDLIRFHCEQKVFWRIGLREVVSMMFENVAEFES